MIHQGVELALKLTETGSPDPSAKARAESDARTSARSRRPARILVVDDEAHVRSMISATLERQGYDVQMASSGREAFETLEQNSFDLVLTDIVMQDGNGIVLLERVHAQQPHLPVVMVTAIHDISVAIDSMRRGLRLPAEAVRAGTPGEHRAARAGTPAGPAGEP